MLVIRRAERRDVPVILSLIRQLAEYEKAPDAVKATAADLVRDGFSGTPRFFVDLAEWDGVPVGFAFWFFNYSTWEGRPGLYLEDLFVEPTMRGRGIGKALLVHLAKIAVAEQCTRFQWSVLDWNTPALDFYRSLGARPLREWITVRMSTPEIAALAAAGDPEPGRS